MCVCRCCTVKGKRLELSTPKLVEVYVVVHGMMVAPRHACSDGIMGAPAPSQGVSALPPPWRGKSHSRGCGEWSDIIFNESLKIISRCSLSIANGAFMLRNIRLDRLSVCLSVCLSTKCIVAKWLIGSGCRLGC